MGGISFGPGVLPDNLSETAGYKSGLALSIEEMCDHLTGTNYPDIIRQSETSAIRLRSEVYEGLFYKLLHRIGYMREEYHGDLGGARIATKYQKKGLQKEYEHVMKIYFSIFRERLRNGIQGPFDFTPVVTQATKELGEIGYQIAMEHYDNIVQSIALRPWSKFRSVNWDNPLELNKLFAGNSQNPEFGQFIDQRFINYLSTNLNRLPEIHWRILEQLTAEFFHREGYIVELGPGANDDGVDVRIWKAGDSPTSNPLCLIQCKRVKNKVEKVVVKGLHADVQHEKAEFGILVTTSELSPGSKNTISARGYPIQEIDKHGLGQWLTVLRTPGTGIVRDLL